MLKGCTGRCVRCGCQLHHDGVGWIDNSGGDVCGWNGGNEPHEDILDGDESGDDAEWYEDTAEGAA